MSSGTNKERIEQNNTKIGQLIRLIETKGAGSGSSSITPTYDNKAAKLIQGTLTEYDDTEKEIFEIPGTVFASNSKLTYVNFPVCSELGRSAFSSCTSLVSAYFPTCQRMSTGAFMRCSRLSDVRISPLTSLDTRCFASCSSLQEISIGCSIGTNIFQSCISLRSVYFLRGVSAGVDFSSSAFSATPLLSSGYLGGEYGSIYFPSFALEQYKVSTNWTLMESRFAPLPSEYEGKCVFDYEYFNSDITEIPEFKRNAEQVELSAFNGCSNLISASLPNCLGIWESAFANCTSLKELYAPECQYLSYNALANCSALEKVTLSPYLRELPNEAMPNTAIKKIALPRCSLIGNGAFSNCTELSNISFPACEYIRGAAFNGCTKLQSINLPNCSTIENFAFISCAALSLAYLPKCYTFETAFQDCSNLKTLIIGTEVDGVITLQNSSTFYGTPMRDGTNGYGSIYVKDDLVDSYKAFPTWSVYSDRITGVSNLPNSIKSKLEN